MNHMTQTPVHENHNPQLLSLIPTFSKKLIEIGCSSGALARAFKLNNADIDWIGVEIDEKYADLASRYCDKSIVSDVDRWNRADFEKFSDRDCWVFGDVLEHLKDPWQVVANIRSVIPHNGSIVVCIPNASHWSLLVRFATGNIRYENQGLLDKTHLRWFSRITIFELFESNGFKVVEGLSRIFYEPEREKFLPLIGHIAELNGSDKETAINDSIPLQYVIRAVPV